MASPPGTAGPSRSSREDHHRPGPATDPARPGRPAHRPPPAPRPGSRPAPRTRPARLCYPCRTPLHATGTGHCEGERGGGLAGRQAQCDRGGGGAGRGACRAGGVPAGRVVRPAQRGAEPGHHPGAGQVGPGAAAGGQRGRHTDGADVRGGRHVQVVEVQDVRGHRPARALGQPGGQPGHPVRPGGQRHRDRVGQRPVGQPEVLSVGFRSAAHCASVPPPTSCDYLPTPICTAISSIIYRVASRGTHLVARASAVRSPGPGRGREGRPAALQCESTLNDERR